MARVTQTDRSLAANIFFGHPSGTGGANREWTTADLDRPPSVGGYDLPYRWANAILRAADDFRARPGLRRYEYKANSPEEKSFARYIAAVRDSQHPEDVYNQRMKFVTKTRRSR